MYSYVVGTNPGKLTGGIRRYLEIRKTWNGTPNCYCFLFVDQCNTMWHTEKQNRHYIALCLFSVHSNQQGISFKELNTVRSEYFQLVSKPPHCFVLQCESIYVEYDTQTFVSNVWNTIHTRKRDKTLISSFVCWLNWKTIIKELLIKVLTLVRTVNSL